MTVLALATPTAAATYAAAVASYHLDADFAGIVFALAFAASCAVADRLYRRIRKKLLHI